MKGGLMLKLVAWTLALTLVGLPLFGVLNGWFASDRWPLRQIKVEAEFNHVSAEQIRATASMHLGGGFFAVQLDEVQRAVAALPWVETSEARKRWPDTIELRVVERQAIARWRDDRLISRSGKLFAVPGADTLQGLPHLAGPDRQLDEVLNFYARSQTDFSGSGYSVVGVELSERGNWRLVLNGGSEILIGHEAPEQRLQRFLAVLPRLLAGRSGFERADLRYSNGFAIQWPASNHPPAMKKPQAGTGNAGAQA